LYYLFLRALSKGTATLNNVYLLLAQGEPPEARRQVATVENLARCWLDIGCSIGLVSEGAMLLGLLTILDERGWE